MLSKRNRIFAGKFLKMRGLLVLLWSLILGLHTWTDNLGDLLRYQEIAFTWNPHPNPWQFFNFLDITKIHHNFLIVKTGHFIGFAIFDLLLFYWKKSHKTAMAISILFAVTTEVLQLFFGRDGRLYDVMIDTFGVVSVYYALKFNVLSNLRRTLFK